MPAVFRGLEFTVKTSVEGCGYPIALEIWEGRLRLIVFDDIHCEDPKIIDLEGARESCRNESDHSQKPCDNDQGLTISLPPTESSSFPLYRVVYVIDVNAAGKRFGV